MRRSRFIKNLILLQRNYVFDNGITSESNAFEIQYLKFPIVGLYETRSEEINCRLRYVSMKLGVFLRIEGDDSEKFLNMRFRESEGFFCYRVFYRQLNDLILERINAELSDVLRCEKWNKKLSPAKYDRKKRKERFERFQKEFES